MPIAGAAAGAQDALQQLLQQAFLQQQAEQQMAMRQRDQDLQERNFAADQEYRAGQTARQGKLDARQVQMDDIAAADRRQGQNKVGVQRMIGDFLMQRGAQPLDQAARNQVQGMAVSEDIDLPRQLMETPQDSTFTLTPGAKRFDATGKVIASVPTAGPTASGSDYITMTSPMGDMRQVTKGPEANKLLAAGWKIQDTGRTRAPVGQERTALAFYNRGKQASDTLVSTGLEDKIAKSGTAAQLQGQYLPNIMQNQDQQMYRQAQRAFTEARLRKESGAAVPDSEYQNDSKTYFAQPGDTPDVIEQKRQARQAVLDGIAFQSGAAYEEYYGQPFQKNSAGVNPNQTSSGTKVGRFEIVGVK